MRQEEAGQLTTRGRVLELQTFRRRAAGSVAVVEKVETGLEVAAECHLCCRSAAEDCAACAEEAAVGSSGRAGLQACAGWDRSVREADHEGSRGRAEGRSSYQSLAEGVREDREAGSRSQEQPRAGQESHEDHPGPGTVPVEEVLRKVSINRQSSSTGRRLTWVTELLLLVMLRRRRLLGLLMLRLRRTLRLARC